MSISSHRVVVRPSYAVAPGVSSPEYQVAKAGSSVQAYEER